MCVCVCVCGVCVCVCVVCVCVCVWCVCVCACVCACMCTGFSLEMFGSVAGWACPQRMPSSLLQLHQSSCTVQVKHAHLSQSHLRYILHCSYCMSYMARKSTSIANKPFFAMSIGCACTSSMDETTEISVCLVRR